MCNHERLAKIDNFWRCRDCGEIFTEKPEAKPVKAAKVEQDEPKKTVKKAPVKKGAK